MICDVHAHYTPKNFSEFMGDRFASPVHLPVKRGMARHPFSDSPEDIEGRFRLMDEAGVEKQVLSPNHPPYLPDEGECVKAVRMLNDGYADLAHRYPQRIASYVMLPLPHIDAALKEMERGFDQLGCVGVNMNIVCLGRSIAETEFEPLYAEMNRRGAVLFVHPAGSAICSPFIIDYNYGGSVGTALEEVRRRAMAKAVRPGVRHRPGRRDAGVDHPADRAGIDPASPGAEEECPVVG